MRTEHDEGALRAELGLHAADAPEPHGLLTAVHDRSRRRVRRQIALTGGLTAIIVAGTVLAVQGGTGPGGEMPGAAGSPSASESTAPDDSAPAVDPVASYAFPYRPTWEPGDFNSGYGARINESLQRLGYLDEPGRENKAGPGLVLDLYDGKPPNWPAKGDEVAVRGTTGTYRPAGDALSEDVLAWEEDGNFLMLRTRQITRADMITYAEGLVEDEGPGYLGVRCGLATYQSEPGTVYQGSTLYESDVYYLWTTIEEKDYAPETDGSAPVTVDLGDRDGVLLTEKGGGERILLVELDPARVIAVHSHPDYFLTDDQLVYEALTTVLALRPCRPR
ncbi:hypothetical protein AB0I28_36390 [Phytomonospora sp. NPDC050363]|uniref:hypothetical protein n=1 Tax=Phytomonospora sp. NPDC050363 TaxID=3155642 RepID=UPI0033E94025